MKFEIHHYAQLGALIIAFIFRRSLTTCRLGIFIPIIALGFITDVTGKYVRTIGWATNYPVYNVYQVIIAPLWMYAFARMLDLKGKAAQIHVFISAVIVALVWFNFLFFQGWDVFNNYSHILLMLAFVTFSCLTLFKLAFSDDFDIPLAKQPLFWINAGTLLFSMVTIVLFGLQQYIIANKIQLNNKSLYRAIMPSVNVLLYLTYSYAFYLCHQKTKSSSSS